MFAQCPNPACGKVAKVPDGFRGRAVRCRHCGHKFTLSAALTGPPPAAPSLAGLDAEPGSGPREAPTLAAGVPSRIGRFPVEAVLGSGAFGVVYRAFDPQLERAVALKVARPGTVANPRAIERFLREARAAARLRHPHIVPVFDAGCDDGRYFIASTFIEGQPLAGALRDGPLEFRRAARIVRDLAEALDYAHRQGIVHRDVKPANVLLDEHGRALLMDFGLAYRQEAAEKLTHDGDLLGTPAYMAPEQARGRTGEPLPASDQYSLGVLLYELLAGRTPFEGPPQSVLFQALHQPPPPLRGARPDVPRDLETICLKALAKRPEDRYPSCQELADDLRRWLEDEPIKARRRSLAERLVRGCRQRPGLALAGAAAVLCLVAAAITLVVAAADQAAAVRQEEEARRLARESEEEARQAAAEAEGQKHRAATAAEEARRATHQAKDTAAAGLRAAQRLRVETENTRRATLRIKERERFRRHYQYVADINLAQKAVAERNFTELRGLLRRHEPARGEEDLRGFAWYYFERAFRFQGNAVAPPDGGIELSHANKTGRGDSFRWNQELNRLLTVHPVKRTSGWSLMVGQTDPADKNRSYGVWYADGTTWRAAYQFNQARPLYQLSPDGNALFEATSALSSRLWVKWGRLIRIELPDRPSRAEFSPDGLHLVTFHGVGTVAAWEVKTGKKLAEISLPASYRDYRWIPPTPSPDLNRLAVHQKNGIQIWDLLRGKRITTLPDQSSSILMFSPDGKAFASSTAEEIKLWDLKAGKPIVKLPTQWDSVVLFAGRFLVHRHAGRVDFVEAATGRAAGRFQVPSPRSSESTGSLVVSRDGKRLVTGGREEPTILWDVATGARRVLAGAGQEVIPLALSPGGERLLTRRMGKDGLLLWDLTGPPKWDTLPGGKGPVAALAFAADGKQLFIGHPAGDVTRCDLETGKRAEAFPARSAPPLALALAPGGQIIATGSGGGEVTVRDLATGKVRGSFPGNRSPARALAFSPDGGLLACGRADGTVQVWRWAAGKEEGSWPATAGPVRALALAPGGKLLACADEGGTVKVWDVAARRERAVFKGHAGAVTALAFTPDGKTLATAGADRVLKLWDLATGQELVTLADDAGGVTALAFRPGANALAAGTRADGTIRLWYRPPVLDLEAVPKGKGGESKQLDPRVRVQTLSEPGNLAGAQWHIGRTYYFRVTGLTPGQVWGTGIYTADSLLAAAAVHAGVLRDGETGVVKVTILAGQSSYQGSTRNGVTSRSWNSFNKSYGVEYAGPAAPEKPLPSGAAADHRTEMTKRQAGVLPDPGNLVGPRWRAGKPYFIRVTGETIGSVWGTEVYTADSVLATAAVHAGVLREGQEGVIKVTVLPGRSSYLGSTRNGVTSQSWRSYDRSYRIEAAQAP